MPSFDAANHSRNFTWPPSLHLLDQAQTSSSGNAESGELHQTHILPDIDEDPFAHFISPVTEEDDPYDEYDFNAGISVSDLPPPNKTKTQKFRKAVAKRWERYLAHHHHSQLQDEPSDRYPSEDDPVTVDDDNDDRDIHYNSTIPTIRITNHSAPYPTPSPDSSPPLLASDSDSSPSSSPPNIPFYDLSARPPPSPLPSASYSRNRAQYFPSSPPPSPGVNIPRRKKGRRRSSRTLSGRRHAWREPSPDLFTVMEGVEMGVMRDADGDVEMDGGTEWWIID